jgi:hypothetical protein
MSEGSGLSYVELMGLPQTLEQAVDRLLDSLEPEVARQIAGTAREELIGYHFSLGQYIRNAFGLWGENAALLDACGTEDADDAAGVIIEALWTRLRAAGC